MKTIRKSPARAIMNFFVRDENRNTELLISRKLKVIIGYEFKGILVFFVGLTNILF